MGSAGRSSARTAARHPDPDAPGTSTMPCIRGHRAPQHVAQLRASRAGWPSWARLWRILQLPDLGNQQDSETGGTSGSEARSGQARPRCCQFSVFCNKGVGLRIAASLLLSRSGLRQQFAALIGRMRVVARVWIHFQNQGSQCAACGPT